VEDVIQSTRNDIKFSKLRIFQYSYTMEIELITNHKQIGYYLVTEVILHETQLRPITVAARSEARTVFARSNTEIVGSNPTREIHVCMRLFCICVVLCVGSDLAKG
jgi:hypothetical protein